MRAGNRVRILIDMGFSSNQHEEYLKKQGVMSIAFEKSKGKVQKNCNEHSMEDIPFYFQEFIEQEYFEIQTWVHANEEYIANQDNYPLNSSPIQVPYPDPKVNFSDEYHFLFLKNFKSISAWVRKNDEIYQELDTGSYQPRLMQVCFSDFLDLKEWL